MPLLVALLGFLGANLSRELRGLSTADVDNLQWTILQVETEIANLGTTLTEAAAAPEPDDTQVRLRADIALSRLLIVGRGAARGLFPAEAAELFDSIDAYEAAMITILDADPDLTPADIGAMRDLTRAIRPDIRALVLLGLEEGAARAESRRAAFSRQLALTGAIAIVLILGLTALLVVLWRLLLRADQRDADLQVSSARVGATVEASLDAIVTANEAGEIVDFNSSAERIFGWRRDDILGRTLESTIIPHRHRTAHTAGMDRYLKTREPHVVDAERIELTALRKTGEEFPVELNITSTKGTDGELFIAYLRDISQRKINEQKLIDARDRAEAMDRAKSQFLAVMSHEMRTPLNGILGVLDLMRQTPLSRQQDRYTRVATASSEILLEHVNEALDITRIELGSMQLVSQPFDLRSVVERTTDVLTPLAHEKDLRLTLSFDSAMDATFEGDGGRIGQILTNLIGNAIKFTDAGQIGVTVAGIHSADRTNVFVTVTDTGRGIAAEHLEDVFEDFVALAHSEGRQTRGDGLGLSISRKVARLMGGDLTVQSTPGAGSTFTLTLPLARATTTATAGSAHRHLENGLETAPDPVEALRVLVVEDNAINRSVLRDMLERLGHGVREAADGLEGFQTAQAQAFDLIVMDVSMPVMDGIEAVRRIRGTPGPNRDTRIIGLTAHGREEYRDRALDAGMTGFFTKPIRFSALREALRLDAGPADAEEVTAQTDLNHAVLDDLVEVLGTAKVQATAESFFEETVAQIDALQATETEADCAAILHKMRGGAALMGLMSLVEQIDSTDDVVLSPKAAAALRNALTASKTALASHLAAVSSEG